MPGNASAKDALRKEMREKLRALTKREITRASAEIRAQLTFQPGERVAIFAGLPTEPQLLPLIKEHPEALWHLPRVTGKNSMEFAAIDATTSLKPGPFGIMEPPEGPTTSHFDTILCPGIAFTKNGARLGQGGGFYDRFLQSSPGTRLIGIAFRCQIVASLPQDRHDIAMHQIVTS
ncbi:5-formyltetrahydrofolate cyclo-ligase [Verrucomicrobiaceae bacterium 227]